MKNANKKTCFIGHRNIIADENITKRLYEAIKKEIANGCTKFTMGTHGNFDKLALSVCKMLRQEFKNIEIEVVITSLNSIKKKTVTDIFGTTILTPFDDVKTVMYDIEEEHFKNRITASNKQMIDTCQTMICYVDTKNTASGAKKAQNYAMRKGLKVINLFKEEDSAFYGMTKEEKETALNDFLNQNQKQQKILCNITSPYQKKI